MARLIIILNTSFASQVHFDIYHRGSRRLESADDQGRKRLMYKFWLSRTKDPIAPSWDHTPQPDDDCPLAFGGEAPGAAWLGLDVPTALNEYLL